MISFGNPPAIKYDTKHRMFSAKITKPNDDRPVLDNILEQLKHVTHANVCLSGGIDSQFALRVAKKLGVPVTAYTYLATWDGSPINSDDVVTAEIIAEKENVPLERIHIDLQNFFSSNLHMQYANEYQITSPQIAVHLYFLEQVFKDKAGTVFLGGEIPMMVKNSSASEGPMDIAGISSGFFMTSTVGYRLLAQKYNLDLVKDLLLYTPDIIYKTLDLSIDLVKEQQIHCELKPDYFVNMYAHKLKHAIYEKILPGGVNPLVKNTGFEKLKRYLASTTGIYNEFDRRYREPLKAEHQRRQRDSQAAAETGDSSGVEGSVRYIAGKLPQELTDKYRDYINKYNSKCIYEYYFDF